MLNNENRVSALGLAGICFAFAAMVIGCDKQEPTAPAGIRASALAAVTAANTGLDFPSNGQTSADIRFRWMGSALQPMYPATYIWRYNPRQQAGYYCNFYYGPSTGWDAGKYYGAPPYPDGSGDKSLSTTHHWSLGSSGHDYTNDANGNNTQLAYGAWKIQALRVTNLGNAGKLHEFFWDLPDTTKVIRTLLPSNYGATPTSPALNVGDAPWSLRSERLSGILRGIQLYSSNLSGADIVNEINSPLSTSSGSSAIWYLNLNPTPDDIQDKSGRNHHPAWVGTTHANLWTESGNPPPVPTVTLTANPTSVNSGSSSTLTWSSTNATGCAASGAWSGNQAVSGSQSTGALSSNSTYTLTCTGAGGSANASATVTVNAPPPPVPTVTLTANPTSVSSGSSSTLTWSSTNATGCAASGAWSGSKAVSGSQSTGTLSSNSTYTLTCTGTGGSANASATVTVNAPPPVPTVTLTANPTSVNSGSSSTLTWSSSNATGCTASGAWSGSKAVSGSQSTGALSSNSTYTLTCTGAGGSANASATVTVNAPPPPVPTVTLTANPTSVSSGSSSTLTWSSSNATGCTASGAWSGSKAVSGSQSTGALSSNSTYTLTCTGAGGSANAFATVTVQGPGGGAITGLVFNGNDNPYYDSRFHFTGGNLQPMYPATIVFRVNPRPQAGYYTTFFWGPEGDYTGNGFYGAHPYPATTPPDNSTTHNWEFSVSGHDWINDANGHSTSLGYNVWRTQAVRVWDAGNAKIHEFYWDLPDTTKVIRVSVDPSYGPLSGRTNSLTFGNAQFSPISEHCNCTLRGIQLYNAKLSVSDILAEINAPQSTSAGSQNMWYLNLNPTPDDITDKSGRGHHPTWWNTSMKASLWTGP